MSRPRFHLAFPVDDLEAARSFYGEILGCGEGRSDRDWVDFNLFGHQLVAHRVRGSGGSDAGHNPVDGHEVPVPHFGLILAPQDFHDLAYRLQASGVEFVIPPQVRFQGLPGEQHTMFFRDPSGNALEFKAFADESSIFAR